MSEPKPAELNVPQKKNTELFEKIGLLIIGFLLTGVVGTYISYRFQYKTSVNNYNMGLIEAERKVGKEVFEEVIKGMDSRIYYAQLVSNSYSIRKGSGVDDKVWTDYVMQMNQWNENVNRRKSLSELYFGSGAKDKMEAIHTGLLDLHPLLRNLKNLDDAPASHLKADNLVASINNNIYQLSKLMIKCIQKDSLGRIPTWKNNTF